MIGGEAINVFQIFPQRFLIGTVAKWWSNLS